MTKNGRLTFRVTLHTGCEPVTVTLQPLSHWWTRPSWSKFALHYAWGTNGVCECTMDVNSTWTPTWHRMNHVPWSLGIFIDVDLLYFYNVWGPVWIKIHWNSIWLRAPSHMTSHYTWKYVTTLHVFGGDLGRPLDTSFGLSQFHGHGSWLVCEVALCVGHTSLQLLLLSTTLLLITGNGPKAFLRFKGS
jgi:hypothetical protein